MRSLMMTLALVGCTAQGSLVVVTVDSAAPLSGVAQLRGQARSGERAREFALTLEERSFPPAHSFAIEVDPQRRGSMALHVEALADDGTILGSADGSVDVIAGKRADLMLMLTREGVMPMPSAPPDMSPHPDMSPPPSTSPQPSSTPSPTPQPSPTAPPAAPTSVSAVANIDLGATVTWTAPAGAVDHYLVACSDGTTRETPDATARFAWSGLTSGTSYTFTVRAVNALGHSPFSAASGSIVAQAAPATPVLPWVCGSDRNISGYLVTTSTGADGYYVYYSSSGPATLSSPRVRVEATRIRIPNLENGVTYDLMMTTYAGPGQVESLPTSHFSATTRAGLGDTLIGGDGDVYFLECLANAIGGPPNQGGVTRTLSGFATVSATAVDRAAGTLFVADAERISIFDHAARLDGEVISPPLYDRSIPGSGVSQLAHDDVHERLYVARRSGNVVLVYANSATSPVAVSMINVESPSGMVFDPVSDTLYVVSGAVDAQTISVYTSASVLPPTVNSPNKTLTISGKSTAYGQLTYDPTTKALYVGGAMPIYRIDDPAALPNGAQSVTAGSFSMMSAYLEQLSVANDRLVASDPANMSTFVFDTASTRAGLQSPTRTLGMHLVAITYVP